MTSTNRMQRMVVGVDGSQHAAEALEWAIRFARPLGAEIVAVFAVPPPLYVGYSAGFAPPIVPPEMDPAWRAEMQAEFEQTWCAPLAASGLPYRTLMEDGRPASVIAAVAEREEADLVVVGRRGRGGFAELLLGSVSHELSHHCTRPVLLVSSAAGAAQEQPALAAATTA